MRRSALERFWAKVDRRGPDECWPWIGGTAGGYGSFWSGATMVRAHRWIYMQLVEALADDLEVCHKCDNPSCCNLAHLFVGSHADNMADLARKGRNRGKQAGAKNGRAKLSHADVTTARTRYTGARGEVAALAREFGVTPEAMGMALRGQTWAATDA